MACSSGASCSLTTFAPEAARASLSEVKYWKTASPTTIRSIGIEADVQNLERTTAKTTYSSAEQRACEQHPEGKTGVATVGLAFHRKSRSLKWIVLIVAWAFALAAGPRRWIGLVATNGSRSPDRLPGLRGLLTSTSTRIPGLIAADDLRHRGRLGTLDVPDAAARVADSSAGSSRSTPPGAGPRPARGAHDRRDPGRALAANGLLATLLRRDRAGDRRRGAPARARGAARPEVVLPVLGLGSVALAAAISIPRGSVVWLGLALLLLFLVVLWAWPETAGFSSIGPRPEQGGRFSGSTTSSRPSC